MGVGAQTPAFLFEFRAAAYNFSVGRFSKFPLLFCVYIYIIKFEIYIQK